MTDTYFNLHKFVGRYPKDDLGNINILDQIVVTNNNYPFPQYNDYDTLKELLKEGKKDKAKCCIEQGCHLNKDCTDYSYDGTPLHLAVSLEYPDIVKLLLEKGATVNSSNDNDETPLMLAAIIGNRQLIDMILAKTEPENYSNGQDLSHLHIACMRNNVDLVQKFLASGADINKPVKKISMFWPGFTPLHFAVEFKSIETANLLIDKGADITIQDSRGLTPLHLAFRKRNRLLTDLLLSKQYYYASNPVDSDGLSHFHIVCAFNDREVVEDFLNKKIDVSHIVPHCESHTWDGYCGFKFAINNQCMNALEYLLKCNPSLVGRNEKRIVDYAYERKDLKILHLIISFIEKEIVNAHCSPLLETVFGKEKINLCNTSNTKSTMDKLGHLRRFSVSQYTELHVAVLQKNKDQVNSILNVHQPSIITVTDAQGKTPLHLAFVTNQKEVVDQLLSLHLELDENPVNSDGLSHFHISCTTKNVLIVEDFINKGVDINMSINMDSLIWAGNTPLHLAVMHRLIEVVKLLLDNGADFTLKNALGLSSYVLAIPQLHNKFILDKHYKYYQDWEFVEQMLLINEGRKVDNFDNRGITLLHIASANGDVDMINRYMSADAINKSTDQNLAWWSGFTPLHFATHSDEEIATKVLLDNGADPAVENCLKYKYIPGHYLYRSGFDDRVFLLSENVYNEEGISIFHIACRCGSLKGAQHFLKIEGNIHKRIPHGCKIGKIEEEGKTPLHVAVDDNHPEIVKLLLEHGADVNARDCYFNTPLYFCKSDEILEMLLNYRADPEALNCELFTALENVIFYSSRTNSMNAVIDNGWDINRGRLKLKDKLGPTNYTVIARHIDRLTELGFNINERNQDIYNFIISNDASIRRSRFIYRHESASELNSMKATEIDSRPRCMIYFLKVRVKW